MPSTNKSDFALGTWDARTDTWTQLLDLNDQTTFAITHGGLQIPQPKKTIIKASNIRSPGVMVTQVQYQERHISVELTLRAASTTAILASIRTLLSIIENPPYCIRLALPGSSSYSYADVQVCEHDIPNDPQTLLALAINKIHMDFTCAVGLRGDRVTLSNLVYNPGFQAPSGPGVTVFNDTFANANAYSSQAGSAPTAGSVNATYPDVVMADAPLRYYRMSEASGSTAYDVSGSGQNATYVGSPTLGTTSGVSGDTNDKAVTLNGTTQYGNVPLGSGSTALPTGNAKWTIEVAVKIASNPATTSRLLGQFGDRSVTRGAPGIVLNTSGQVFATTNAGDTAPTSALSLNVWHLIHATWDGTTLAIYVDGTAGPTATPGALSIGTHAASFGINEDKVTSTCLPGVIDEFAIYPTNLSSSRITAHWNAFNAGTGMGTSSNTLSIPISARVAFGSPDWSAYNTWRVRFRWTSGGSHNFYLHFTDSSNYLQVNVQNTSMTLTQKIAANANTLGTTSFTLASNVWYWLVVTQFPQPALTGSNLAPGVSATLYTDGNTAGTLGAQFATTGTVATQDSVTALSGRPQLEAGITALILGGNYSNVHTVALFGPGAWSFTGTNGGSTGVCSGAWELDTTKTYPSGPVTSYGAARIDMAPAGTMGCAWQNYSGGAVAGTYAMPVGASGDVVYASIYAKTNSVGVASTLKLNLLEYDSGGTLKATTALQTVTGGTTASGWQQLSGHVTTGSGGTTAYCGLQVLFTDTNANASANGILWLDNAQCWDATSTNTTAMPYCELRFPQAPTQLLVSGIVGDIKAPAHVSLGTYMASWPAGSTLLLLLGRRSLSSGSPLMVGAPHQPNGWVTYTPVLSSTSWGGWYTSASAGVPLQSISLASHASDMLGVYHLYCLSYSANPAPATYIGLEAFTVQRSAPFMGGTVYGSWYGSTTYPIASQNTWTLTDAGQVMIPSYNQGSLADQTQSYFQSYPYLIDNNFGSPAVMRLGWSALMPIDAEILIATANNPNGASNFTNSWLFLYADGLVVHRGGQNDIATFLFSSSTSSPLIVPSLAVGGTGSINPTSQAINVNPTGDTYLALDPMLTGANSSTGVNELCAILTDGNATVLPFAAEVRYSPQYLYPR